jgi:hypothetical protein
MRGVRTVTLVAESFWQAARLQAEMHGLSGLVLLKVPHPHNTSNLPVSQIEKLAEEIFPHLLELMAPTGFQTEQFSRSAE